jgi:PAS domain-containing protein
VPYPHDLVGLQARSGCRFAEHLAASEPRINEDRFRGLVEASLQGILVHHDFVPLFANRALAGM